MHQFNKKKLWYLVTVCGFTIGLSMGGMILSNIPILPWLEILFWAIPASGAGLGMGIGQWILLRRKYKYAYVWVFVTTIGVIGAIGGTLLLAVVINALLNDTLSIFFAQFTDWFVPWLNLLVFIAPIAILIGPFCQWLITHDKITSQSFKEILKANAGWVLAILVLGFMLFFSGTILRSHNSLLNLIIFIVSTIPSGLIFAHATMFVITADHDIA